MRSVSCIFLNLSFFQVFRALEYPAEVAKQEYYRQRLLVEREMLLSFVSQRSGNGSEEEGMKMLSDHLAVYERVGR